MDFELLMYSISHTTAEGTKITTNVLKTRAVYNEHQTIFNGLLKYLKK